MNTAISLPDARFDSAEALAVRLGLSRSQLYATALARCLAEHAREDVAARLAAVYGGPEGVPSDLDPGFAELQRRAIGGGASGPAEW